MDLSHKENKRYLGIKAYIGMDAESKMVLTLHGTFGNEADNTKGNSLLRGEETEILGDAGYQETQKRPNVRRDVI